MSTAAITPDQELETVQHPTLGPLQFPKSMPYEERNAAIERLESQHQPGFFEPHQEQGTGIIGRAKEFGRGALANTAGIVAHPLNALHGLAQTFSEGIGMTPIAPE